MTDEETRDQFAMFALGGLLAHYGISMDATGSGGEYPTLADFAYLLADACMRRRERGEEDDD